MNSRNYKKSREDKYILLVKSKCNAHWPQITDKSLLLLPLGYAWLSNQCTPFAFLQKEKYYLNKAVHSNFSGSQKSVACRAFFQIHGSCIRRINPFDVCFKTLYTRASEYRMQALPHCSLNIHYGTRRIWLNIGSFFNCACPSFPSFSWSLCLIQGWYC